MVRSRRNNAWNRPEGERWLDQDQGININRCKKIGFESRIRFHSSFALRASLPEPMRILIIFRPTGEPIGTQNLF